MDEEKSIERSDKKEELPNGNAHPDSNREVSRTDDQQLETSNQQQVTSMEVHKHPHHVTHKKKWGEYLLEFLMLFLAVFLGVLAEYQLEHKIEKDKEIQYIHSLVEDLSTDTANLRETITNFNRRDKNLDTLLSLFSQLPDGYNHKLHEKLHAITGFADFVKADQTMQQLKTPVVCGLSESRKLQMQLLTMI
jgi:hypothetical protein